MCSAAVPPRDNLPVNIQERSIHNSSSIPATSTNEAPSTSSHQEDSMLQGAHPSPKFSETFESLKQIFVGRDPEELTMAALKNDNLHDAINEILDSALDENASSGQLLTIVY
jgi:hypothetical protein